MAVNYPGFGPTAKPDLSGIGDLIENIGKGYQIGRMPDHLREEQEGRMRDNAMKAIQQAFMPQEKQAQLEHIRAQTEGLKAPKELGGETAQLLSLRAKYPEGTQERKIIDQMIEKKTQATAGTQFTFDPDTKEFSFSQGGPATSNAPQSLPGMPPLKKGDNYVYHPETKEPIGIASPPNPGQIKEEGSRAFFNIAQPFITKAAGYYSGPGATAKLTTDIYNMQKGDEDAKNRIIDFWAARDLVTGATAKEMAALGTPNVREVFRQTKDTLQGSDINKNILKGIKGYTIPSEIQQAASARFNELVNSAQEASSNAIPAQKIRYFNQPKQTPRDRERESVGEREHLGDAIVIPSVVQTDAQFQDFLGTLTPKERAILRKKYVKE